MTLSIPILNYGTKVTRRTGLIIILRQSKESANHWQSHSAWTVCVVLYQHMVHNIVVAYNILFSRKYSQLGMPLQGLHEPSKLRLFEQLTSKAITLEEFKRMAASIKKKKGCWGIHEVFRVRFLVWTTKTFSQACHWGKAGPVYHAEVEGQRNTTGKH